MDVLRLESLHIPSRRLSQPANLIRAVSIVDVETFDVDVATRSRRLLEILYRSWTCLNELSSFSMHARISDCMLLRLFTRSATLDGEKLCLSTTWTYASEFSLEGRAIDCKFVFSDSVRSVSRSRVIKVSSRALQSF
jgi:hypothetical protein